MHSALDSDGLVPRRSEAKRARAERSRVLEVAKYYAAAHIVPRRELDSQSNPIPAEPALAADPTLTCLAQLGTLRLNCARAVVSLIDAKFQYVAAEATRTLSSRQPGRHAPNDGMFLGVLPLDRTWGVSANAMHYFTDDDDENAASLLNLRANRTRYVIRDLGEDERFKDSQYVAGWPHLHAWAAVPLVSPRGLVIGAYCVVDDKPRDDFDDDAIFTLTEVADSIMQHLELNRVRDKHDRSERLLKGLGLFIEGKTSIRQWWMDNQASTTVELPTGGMPPPPTVEQQADSEFGFRHNADQTPVVPTPNLGRSSPMTASSADTSGLVAESSGTNAVASTTPRTTPQIGNDVDPLAALRPDSRTGSRSGWESAGNRSPLSSADDAATAVSSRSEEIGAVLQQVIVSREVKSTFARASNLIRESVDLEGVVFLDACQSGFSTRKNGKASSRIPTGPKNEPSSSSSDDDASALDPQAMCARLGFSTRLKSSLVGNRLSLDRFNVSEGHLQRMLKRFPRGHVFLADENGLTTSSESDGSLRSNATHRRSRNSSQRTMDANKLFELFPGSRSIIFLPLWDFHKERWFAGALTWSADPIRVLENCEITHLTAFGNSIMTQISQAEALATSRAKSDFISSVSHELRSPLHGILASAEILHENVTSPSELALVDMVQTCGSTLLDTMNHLLDFAKINNLTMANEVKARESKLLAHNPQEPEKSDATSVVDLAELVQDVVQSMHFGHSSRKSVHNVAAGRGGDRDSELLTPLSPLAPFSTTATAPVLVTMNIENRQDWRFNTVVGAWKRIVMNVVGNALKYTQQGCIVVDLRTKSSANPVKGVPKADDSSAPRVDVCLTVHDTGQGMNADFIKHRMFVPFSQEDSLAVGMGLGLSIIHQIVRNLGGKIDVKSELEVGTDVTIRLPCNPLGTTDATLSTDLKPTSGRSPQLDPDDVLVGRRLCLCGLDADLDSAEESTDVLSIAAKRRLALRESLTWMAMEWFRMEVVTAPAKGELRPTDVLLADESFVYGSNDLHDPREGDEKSASATRNVLLVISSKPPTRDQMLWADYSGAAFLQYPFGPKKFALVLLTALDSRRERTSTPEPSLQLGPAPALNHKNEVIEARSRAAEDVPNTTPETRRPLPTLAATGRTDSTETITPAKFAVLNRPSLQVSQLLSASTQPLSSTHVLLVDDNSINLKVLIMSVKKLGCTYAAASNGLEAVEAFKTSSRPFNFVFMDISMPVMDGFAATRAIRAYERSKIASIGTNNPSSPGGNGNTHSQPYAPPAIIIAVTGLGSAVSQQEAFASGMNIFMTKPMPMKELQTLLDKPLPVAR